MVALRFTDHGDLSDLSPHSSPDVLLAFRGAGGQNVDSRCPPDSGGARQPGATDLVRRTGSLRGPDG